MRRPRILLVNPPIYDFTAYDFWLRPYGLMRVAGKMRRRCELSSFDYLTTVGTDAWGRGSFERRAAEKPEPLGDIPRKFHRFGRPREEFRRMLETRRFDAVLVQTLMTYWYPGIREVIDDVRRFQPAARIVLGGVYATLCPDHARSLGADLVIEGAALEPLWRLLSIEPRDDVPCQLSSDTGVGILKLSEGCPFSCTYCSAPLLWPGFSVRPVEDCLEELRRMAASGAHDIAFYDDALLYDAGRVLVPFLEASLRERIQVRFHTPNGLNARFMTPELSALMIKAGFTSFYFGLESGTASWQQSTGGKLHSGEFEAAAGHLRASGAGHLFAYVIVGHPDAEQQEAEQTLRFAHECSVKVMLSEFSPIPGTVDGEKCSPWADLDEPLSHNKTAFAIRRLGVDRINRIKELNHSLNSLIDRARIN